MPPIATEFFSMALWGTPQNLHGGLLAAFPDRLSPRREHRAVPRNGLGPFQASQPPGEQEALRSHHEKQDSGNSGEERAEQEEPRDAERDRDAEQDRGADLPLRARPHTGDTGVRTLIRSGEENSGAWI